MKKELEILIERYIYSSQTTIGKMLLLYDASYITNPVKPVELLFGYTLEDTVRPDNIKVSKETALPGGLKCNVSLYDSPRHGKTIIFHTESDGITIRHGNLSWTYCLVHGGNTHKDTEGCVLLAKNFIDYDYIQGSLKNELRLFIEEKIKEGYSIKARFVNLTQTKSSWLNNIYPIRINVITLWRIYNKLRRIFKRKK